MNIQSLPWLFVRNRAPILVCCLLLLSSSEAVGANLGNVMPLGDSITVGFGDPAGGGYRDPLYTLLADAGHTVQFVGTQTDFQTPLLASNGQQNHEGHAGYVIEAGTSGQFGIRDNIESYLDATDPSLILLMIGTNDMFLDYESATAPDRLSNLLADIDTLKPNAHTIVANLIPVHSTRSPLFERVVTYNAAVPGVVATHQGLGHKVSYLDMYSFLTAPDDLLDVVHPTAAGYDNMALGWEAGINALLVPEPSPTTSFSVGLLSLLGWRWRRKRRFLC